jgi:hypothetical protein
VRKKAGGRPVTTGTGKLIGLRILPPLLKRIDAWIAKESDKPSRPEAMRRLIERGLD